MGKNSSEDTLSALAPSPRVTPMQCQLMFVEVWDADRIHSTDVSTERIHSFMGEVVVELPVDSLQPVEKPLLQLPLQPNARKRRGDVKGHIALGYQWIPEAQQASGGDIVGTLTVIVHSARDCLNCDVRGKSDPYARVTVWPTAPDAGKIKQSVFKTQTIDETLNPTWNESCSFKFAWPKHSLRELAESSVMQDTVLRPFNDGVPFTQSTTSGKSFGSLSKIQEVTALGPPYPSGNSKTVPVSLQGFVDFKAVSSPKLEEEQVPSGPPPYVKELAKKLHDDRWHIRAKGAESLGQLRHLAFPHMDELKVLLKDREQFVREVAGLAIARIENAMPLAEAEAQKETKKWKSQSATSVVAGTSLSVNKDIKQTELRDYCTPHPAIINLPPGTEVTAIGVPELLGELIVVPVSVEGAVDLRACCIASIPASSEAVTILEKSEKLSDASYLAKFRQGLKDIKWWERSRAATTLGHMGQRSAPYVKDLEMLLQDNAPNGLGFVREAAQLALLRIAGKEFESLEKLVSNQQSNFRVTVDARDRSYGRALGSGSRSLSPTKAGSPAKAASLASPTKAESPTKTGFQTQGGYPKSEPGTQSQQGLRGKVNVLASP